ncbi:MAG: type IX secretion system sortase PorU [Fimbriimonadaceae bacterium]|nr:type IX secretion system sortase PorU [Chitinophagales bacterium]
MIPKLYLQIQIAILTLFAASSVYANDQIIVNRSLEWNDSTYYYFSDGSVNHEAVYFKGASFDYESSPSVPVWAESFEIESRGIASIEIINPVYEPIKRQDLIKGKKISGEINTSYYFTKSRTKNYVVVSFIPIRKNSFTGKYEKLISFTLQINIQPDANANSFRGDDEHTYAASSVLEIGTWYKIGTTKEGVYKIDKSFLTELGINTESFNAETFGIFGTGGMLPEANDLANYDDLVENNIYRSGLEDGSFDDGDYILFYANGADNWKFNVADESYAHQKHLYSDVAYYFITTDMGTDKNLLTQISLGTATYSTTDYDHLFVWDNDKINLVNSGRRWFDTPMDAYTEPRIYSTTIPSINTDENAVLQAYLAAKSSTNTPKISITGSGADTNYEFAVTPVTTESDYAKTTLLKHEFEPPASGDINLTVTFDASGSDLGWVDYIELISRANLNYNNAQLIFRDSRGVGTGNYTEYKISGSGDIFIWDITNENNVLNQDYDFSSTRNFTLPSDTLKQFIAFSAADAFPSSEITFAGAVANQNLHDVSNTPEYIIISHPDFISEARRLAAWHYDTHNYDTLVATIDQVYNEFSSGTQDITAIRNMMRMFYDRAAGDESIMPKYLLLLGDASFDYKNILFSEELNSNYVPTYESYESNIQTQTYPTDDYFGCLDSSEGADMSNDINKLDIGIGRFPVREISEATDIINKIMHYKSTETFGNWRNTICFIADDEDGNTHIDDADDIATFFDTTYPQYNLNKLYLDAYQQVPGAGGERYPDVNIGINNQIFTGALIINWAGHGNEQNWAQERILSVDDINSWTNYDKLPLFITATCSFSRFDNPERTSAGELILLNPQGGGVGLVSTVRIVYSNANYELNSNFNENAFAPIDGIMPTLGTAFMMGKNAVVSQPVNTRKFFLFGDPGIQLNYPKYNVKTTEVNGIPIVSADTLKALEKVTIKGIITDQSGIQLTGFNGTVYPTVYDKPINVTTLVNDPGSYFYTFKLQKNAIYKGKASVDSGAFEYSFVVPKDISYDFGNGKLSYYANNETEDAGGYEKNVFVGGTADSIATDNDGPAVDVYMNDESFVFGGLTDEDPFLYVVLEDSNGMNTVGNGIGHDITSTLDENQQSEAELNEYYEAELDNYQKGTVKYPLRDIAAGRHSIRVKAWDVYNNSGEGYTEFVVAESAKLALDHVLNYPNPFTTNTSFWFEHNRPGDILDVKVEVFTVSGKLIKTIQQQVQTDGYRVSDIAWDGLDNYGDQIGRGVYVYKLTVIANSDRSKANEFQKLVILR